MAPDRPNDPAPLLEIAFEETVIHWRGPAPFFFVPIPDRFVGEVRHAARVASYGWGCVPVSAEIGGVDFTTALFPKGETYMLPLKAAVRKQARVELGDCVRVVMRVHAAVSGAERCASGATPAWMREF